MSCYSFKSDDEESVVFSEDNIATTSQKKGTSKRLAVKPEKKPVSKKTKKSTAICYTDKILDLITDPTIPTDAENTLNIKKDDCSLTVKTPVDNTAPDYWTIAHYKCAKIANVALQDRWKHAECSLKISLTGQHPDDLTTAKEMVTLIQSVFDKMMRHPAKKLLRHRPKKINL
ncbi:uncharacterized protein LOC126554332 [Aphis gossypii]|uniref:uncharacterized protein LOC126554332 n=1 Tax=Aphis gossypii TaxID=80765 RepID=UPI0021592075|nr:uncharacterized protein LOC126554332 [Aphis gossypii]